ncbi:MAG: murein transglycosylase, partial [Deltaproteobacteria bacterium]|nr:murein transglycosylase [Deltaproteobacteria bacterium]
DSRKEIVDKQSLQGRAGVIAYVDEIELFFLQIQGSGLIRFPDGRVKRINYADKNG